MDSFWLEFEYRVFDEKDLKKDEMYENSEYEFYFAMGD